MHYSIGDLLDRLSIVLLKEERQPEIDVSKEKRDLEEAVDFWKNLTFNRQVYANAALEELKRLNGMIWDRESDIRRGKEKILGLEEVGRRAIEIRDINVLRVEQKNKINAEFACGYQEIKHTLKKPNYDVCIIGIKGVGMAHAIACERLGWNIKAVLDVDESQKQRVENYTLWINQWGPYKDEIAPSSRPLFTTNQSEFGDIEADILIISCPTRFHAEYVNRYGDNYRWILCEKPFDFSVDAIMNIPQHLRSRIAVGHKWMCHSQFPDLIAPPYYIAQGHEFPPQRPDVKECEVWWDLGIHSVAALLHYLPKESWGSIEVVKRKSVISRQKARVIFAYSSYPYWTTIDVKYESIGDGEVQIADKLLHWENLFDNQLKRVVTNTHPANYELGLKAVQLVKEAEEACVASTEPLVITST